MIRWGYDYRNYFTNYWLAVSVCWDSGGSFFFGLLVSFLTSPNFEAPPNTFPILFTTLPVVLTGFSIKDLPKFELNKALPAASPPSKLIM